MKSKMTIIFLLFLSSFLLGQTAENLPSVTEDKISAEDKKLTTNRPLVRNHQMMASKQIKTFLTKELNYNETLQKYAQEADITITAQISESGLIRDFKISSSTNKKFNEIVKDAMSKMKSISPRESKYYGPKNIDVKIEFRI